MMVEELMIGDWVSWYGSPHEIDIKDFEEAHNYKNPLIYIYEPIPITPEILENNGFSKCVIPSDGIHPKEEFWKWERKDEKGRQMVQLKQFNVWELNINNVGTVFYDAIRLLKCIENVNELQQAFKVCKIDKDIKL